MQGGRAMLWIRGRAGRGRGDWDSDWCSHMQGAAGGGCNGLKTGMVRSNPLFGGLPASWAQFAQGLPLAASGARDWTGRVGCILPHLHGRWGVPRSTGTGFFRAPEVRKSNTHSRLGYLRWCPPAPFQRRGHPAPCRHRSTRPHPVPQSCPVLYPGPHPGTRLQVARQLRALNTTYLDLYLVHNPRSHMQGYPSDG